MPKDLMTVETIPLSDVAKKGTELFNVSSKKFLNWRWQMKNQVTNLKEAESKLKLSQSEVGGFKKLHNLFHAGVTPYYLTLSLTTESDAIRRQAIPDIKELFDPSGVPDPLEEKGHSPVKEVVHLYPDRVAFCVAQLCPVYCRYCFRKRRDEEQGLHFNRTIISRGIEYIQSNPAIKDVLITGGDPFIASDEALDSLLTRLRAIPHVDIIRIGTRTPVTLPYRITERLAKILRKHHPVWLNTHFNHPDEITPDASQALDLLSDAGIPLGNQAVLLKKVNDDYKIMKDLCWQLVKNRVRPYYVFQPHLISGTEHFRVPIEKGMEIMSKLRGNISGYAIPTYILDTPSGKVPLTKNRVLGRDGNDLLIEDLRGEIWRELDILGSPAS